MHANSPNALFWLDRAMQDLQKVGTYKLSQAASPSSCSINQAPSAPRLWSYSRPTSPSCTFGAAASLPYISGSASHNGWDYVRNKVTFSRRCPGNIRNLYVLWNYDYIVISLTHISVPQNYVLKVRSENFREEMVHNSQWWSKWGRPLVAGLTIFLKV